MPCLEKALVFQSFAVNRLPLIEAGQPTGDLLRTLLSIFIIVAEKKHLGGCSKQSRSQFLCFKAQIQMPLPFSTDSFQLLAKASLISCPVCVYDPQ